MSTTGARSPRVFIGPVEIAGYYTRLAGALRDVGVDAVSVDLSGHTFRYEATARPPVVVRLATAATVRGEAARSSLGRLWWRAANIALRLALFGWAAARFDSFIFGYGQTLLGGRELPLLRRLGKRIVFVFNGSDARPPYIDGADMAASRGMSIRDCIALAGRKKERIRRIERYAHVIVSQPAFSLLFERPVVDFFRIGVPWTPGAAAASPHPGPMTRIVHSPSNPEVKGSDRIRETVDRLRAEGRDLELVELSAVPNEVVRREIARADFVIDQLYSDAPMVAFATEAATAGRPAIVGGYAWPQLHAIYDEAAMPPVQECHPDELRDAIVRLVDDRAYRDALGARAKAFVESAWSRRGIAERYLALLRGDVDPAWLFDPRRLRYVRGVGLDEERARKIVAAVIDEAGVAALQLSDKPELEQAFVDFAAGP